jgi:hypothetical protein
VNEDGSQLLDPSPRPNVAHQEKDALSVQCARARPHHLCGLGVALAGVSWVVDHARRMYAGNIASPGFGRGFRLLAWLKFKLARAKNPSYARPTLDEIMS